MSTHVRADESKSKNKRDRWGEQITRVEGLDVTRRALVHVMDREGDDYGLFALMLENQYRFVGRLLHNRLLDADASDGAEKLEHALELETPEGESPVEWVLVTSELVDTEAHLLQVLDGYRARWTIEEFFKALKTGCAHEKRQMEDLHGLQNVLALFGPIAWHLLLLRSQARDEPSQPATTVLAPTQLEVLRAFARKPLPDRPTVRDAYLAIAALGGHIKHDGDPGWQTLGRGYEKLITLVEGWCAASAAN